MVENWLPLRFEINGKSIYSYEYKHSLYQVVRFEVGKGILFKSGLMYEWISEGFIKETELKSFDFGEIYYCLMFSETFTVSPISSVEKPYTKSDAVKITKAINFTRSLTNKSLDEGIYCEELGLILPIKKEGASDLDVISKWLCGGVCIQGGDLIAIDKASPLDKEEVRDVFSGAGIELRDVKRKFDNKQKQKKKTSERNLEKFAPEGKFCLPGRLYIEEFFNDHVIDIIKNHKRYKSFGVNFPSAILMYGLPGSGKTFAVEKLIEFLEWPSYKISSQTIASKYIHETGKLISEVFDRAIENAPSVLVIDEMEAYLSDRNNSNSGDHKKEEVGEFLRRIPEAIESNVLILAMTNLVEHIDPAIRRRGRFDHEIEILMPTSEEVESLVYSLLESLPTEDGLDISLIVTRLTGKALSDSVFVVKEAARMAAKSGKNFISQEELDLSLNSFNRSTDATQKKRSIGFVTDED